MYDMGDTLADIKKTFLNGVVKEQVYVEKPLGVETHDRQTRVQIKEGLVQHTQLHEELENHLE